MKLHPARVMCEAQEELACELTSFYASFPSELLRLQHMREEAQKAGVNPPYAYYQLMAQSGHTEAEVDAVDAARQALREADKKLRVLINDLDHTEQRLYREDQARGHPHTANLGPSRYFERGPLPYVHRFTRVRP